MIPVILDSQLESLCVCVCLCVFYVWESSTFPFTDTDLWPGRRLLVDLNVADL